MRFAANGDNEDVDKVDMNQVKQFIKVRISIEPYALVIGTFVVISSMTFPDIRTAAHFSKVLQEFVTFIIMDKLLFINAPVSAEIIHLLDHYMTLLV